ncbi:MAG TPA: sigma-70 family RNA polymerase sigma factor [Opitutaceae bacterium]|nr:sigma-70 family RNA polymerase sigma factor [Opitutaceae bacterium]
MTNNTATATSSNSAQEAIVDAGLVARFNAGDESAFVEIMNRYRSKTFSIALGLLRNRSDAEEITQDTFIRAHRGLARFRGDSSLATWLHRIAVNLARNRYWYFFRRRRQDSLSLDHVIGDGTSTEGTFADLIAAETRDPAQESVRSEFTGLIGTCMEKLDKKHREILTLRNVLNLPYEEIARMLHINVGTVKSRIARARENLRELLAEMCPEFKPAETGADYFLTSRPAYGRPTLAYA